MSEEWALRQAVIATPEDDLPRLVYADWLDEVGDPGHAEFIRTQVELARTPAWEPFAVQAKYRRPEWLAGTPWRQHLPRGEWHESRPFRRGFGWSIRVRQLSTFLELAPDYFAAEPIGELILPAATLDDWQAFAQSPWLARVKSLRFTTGTTLSEPIRALAASPYSTGIESIAFEVCTSPGIGAVVEMLMQSPLVTQLKELEFRIGHDRDGDILFELNRAKNLALERLTFATMGQTPEALVHLAELPNADQLKMLSFQQQYAGGAMAEAMAAGLRMFPLQQFAVLAGQLTGTDIVGFAERSLQRVLQSLNLSENIFDDISLLAFVAEKRLAKLRSLQLRRCGLDDAGLAALLAASFWENLVELDLRGNRFTEEGLLTLLSVKPPRDLTAIVFSGPELNDRTKQSLGEHFNGAAVFEAEDAA